jgi:hypothetical protein
MPHRFVFICGLHRSGTSLAHRLLAAHPQVSGFHDTGAPEDEGQHLQSVYPPARQFGGPGKFCFSPDAYLTERSPLVTEANRRKLFEQWSRYWDVSKPVLIEKSPPNIIRSRFLQAMFPESYFIFLVRHPIAVSLATQKWSKTQLPELMKHWELAHAAMLEDRKHLKHHLLLRYEDFVADPQSALADIYQFLGLPPAPLSEPVTDSINQEYFAKWEENREVLQCTLPERFGYRLEAPYITQFSLG